LIDIDGDLNQILLMKNKSNKNTWLIVCDFGCGAWQNGLLINEELKPKELVLIDRPAQIQKAMKTNKDYDNVTYSTSIGQYKNKFDKVFLKHVLVTMDKKTREYIIKDIFESIKHWGHIIVGETNLEMMVKTWKKTDCEIYPKLKNPKEYDTVNTILVSKTIKNGILKENTMTLTDYFHSPKWIITLLANAWFQINEKDIKYIDSNNIENAYMIYTATKI